MYWYYKVPLLTLAFLLLFGCGYLVWRHLPDSWTAGVRQVGRSAVGTDEAPGAPAAEAPSAAGGRQSAPATPAPAPVSDQETMLIRKLAQAELHFRNENLVAARNLAQAVLNDLSAQPLTPLWRRAADVVSQVNTVLINSDAPAPEKLSYIVAKGDSLEKIARRFKTTVAALQRGNRIDPTNPLIYPGNVLRVYQADWNITVLKSHFVLLLQDGDQLFKLYTVGIGRQNRTPVGIFQVENKLKEPVWTPPGKVIPYGDPQNVLGTRWLGLVPVEGTNPAWKGYGIHGTWQPETVGTPASQGCVRMRNEEVNELFDIVPIGIKVVIKDE